MKKRLDIPSHSYTEAFDKVQRALEQSHPLLDPQLPFLVTRFELMSGVGVVNYPHRHDCYEVLYISEGEGIHIIDFVPYQIKPPMFFFLSKDQVHFWQLIKPLKGYALLFTEEFLGFSSSNIIRSQDFCIFNDTTDSPWLSVADENLSVFNGLFADIEQEFHHENARSISVLRAYLHILLTKIHRLYLIDHPEMGSVTSSSLVRQFKQLVSEYFITEHGVHDYAKRMGITTSHLKDTVKAITGSAPGSIIRQQLIVEAKRLLAHSNVTVAEIGYCLNFEDASYFGRFFKRETGMSPIAFRQQVRNKYQISPE